MKISVFVEQARHPYVEFEAEALPQKRQIMRIITQDGNQSHFRVLGVSVAIRVTHTSTAIVTVEEINREEVPLEADYSVNLRAG